jgi:translation initiation factor IF-2
MVLEEFYQNLRSVGVSAVTGEGMDELLTAVDECAQVSTVLHPAGSNGGVLLVPAAQQRGESIILAHTLSDTRRPTLVTYSPFAFDPLAGV